MIDTSVSVNPYESLLVNFVGRTLVESLTSLAPTILPPPLSTGFSKLCLMFGCGSLDRYHLSKLNQAQVNNLNRPIAPGSLLSVLDETDVLKDNSPTELSYCPQKC